MSAVAIEEAPRAARLGVREAAARLLPYFRPYASRFVIVVVVAVVSGLAEGGQAMLLEPLLNKVLLRGDAGDQEEEDQDLRDDLTAPPGQGAVARAFLAAPVAPPKGDPTAALAALRVGSMRAMPAAWRESPLVRLLSRTQAVLVAQAREPGEAPGDADAAHREALARQALAESLVLPDPLAAPPPLQAAAAALSMKARGQARDSAFIAAFGELGRVFLMAAALAVVLGVSRFLVTVISAEVVAQVYRDLQVAVMRRVLSLSLGQLHATTRGDLMSRLTSDLARLVNGVLLPLIEATLIQPVKVFFLLAVAAWVSWPLTLGLLALGLVVMWPIVRWGKTIRRSARVRQSALAEVFEALHQMLQGFRIVKAFRREAWERERFEQKTEAAYAAEVSVVRARTASRTWIHLVNDITYPLVFLGGGALVVHHTLDLHAGRFATFALLLLLIYRPTKAIVTAYNTLQDCLPSMDRALEVLDLSPQVTSRPGAPAIGAPRVAIELDHVTFRYGDKVALSDVSLRAPAGTTTALVGVTGAGKTTLIDLLARFADPTSGRVLVDGQPLTDVDLASWQSHVALVSQDGFLFNDTVRENIRYGRLDATDAEVEAAAKEAYIHDEVLALKGGYDAPAGEGGGRLSGGQVQRITIARAILRRPDVLLLDEAMSALDTRTEGLVQAALAKFMQGKTSFVIAHRLSTVREATKIVVMHDGRVAEQGTHADLLAKGGRYAELVQHLKGEPDPKTASEPKTASDPEEPSDPKGASGPETTSDPTDGS